MLGSVSAGSNGDAPQEGQSWVINQDTHVWDEEISVKDIVVNLGRTLKLENVSLTSEGFMEIRGEARWINSTVYHEQDNVGDNISLYGTLKIINSDLTMATIQQNSEITANMLDLNPGSIFIVTDFDQNPTTTFDRSNIISDVIGKGDYTERLDYTVQLGRLVNNVPGSGIPNTKVFIENSNFEYIKAIRFTGEGSYVRNSTFDMIGIISYFNDGFLFTNNSILNSYIYYDLFVSGNNSLIEGNTFANGTRGIIIDEGNHNRVMNNTFRDFYQKDGVTWNNRGVISFQYGNNNTLSNNLFDNITVHALSLVTSKDNTISYNLFNNSGILWHSVVDYSGERNNYNNNTFNKCGTDYFYWQHSCILIVVNWWDSYDDRYGGEHLLENNQFFDFRIGINIESFQDNNIVRNNSFNEGWNAIGLWAWPEAATAPSGNLIANNTIINTDFPIALDFEKANYPGINNIVVSNHMTNTSGRAISVWGCYQNFTIKDNYIDNASLGIWIFDNTFGEIANGIITNNILKNITYNGVSAYTQFGSSISMNNIHVENNFIHTLSGVGIFFRDVEEGYIANNTIQGNMSANSQVSGILANYVPKTMIKNNTVSSAVGIEVGGSEDITFPIRIENNVIHVNDYGIISNRTYSQISNNNITGLCTHDKCNILYLQKVGAVGVFSQEGEIDVFDNIITDFKEGITVVLADFNLDGNTIDFSGVAISANNSDGKISNNIITNNTQTISSYKSDITILSNDFSDFEKGLYSFNSTVNLDTNSFEEGDFCLDLIDSHFSLQNNDFNCRDMDYLVRYNLRINIADDEGTGSRDHSFLINDASGDDIIDSQTNSYGYSSYYMLDVISKAADENEINNNPFKISYYNNDIAVNIYKNISYNHTVLALIDTTPPQSEIIPKSGLVKTELVELEISLLNGDNDFKEYLVEYIVNEQFAEWEVYGVYTQSPVFFTGEDGKEYRFRSLARDIYGNVEQKDNYEYQVLIDTSVPQTELLNFDDDYYFIGNNQIDLIWINSAEDILHNTIKVEYSNFTNSNLNPNSVTWTLIDSIVLFDETEYSYDFSGIGHYAFTIEATDYAGNIEVKPKYDVIMNYATKTDTISFPEVPSRWGSNNLDIILQRSSLNLDYEIYIAIQSIEEGNNALTWYLLPHEISSNLIQLRDLQDSTRYFVYAESRDLAGNIEDPLNTTEFFSSNGQYNQQFELKYIPVANEDHNFIITIDNDLDGAYEKQLNRGFDKNKLLVDQFYLDVTNKTIIFGGTSNGGFVPTEDINNLQNIKVEYSGVHLIFEIYTDDPAKADSLTISHSNATELIITYNIPQEAETCRVQMTTDVSNWFTQEIIAPCESGFYEYYHKDPEPEKQYYYRIMIEDEFGHQSFSDNRTADMQDIIKLYSSGNANTNNQFGMKEILPAAIGISLLFLLFGGVLLYRSKGEEELDENVSVIESKPVAKYKVEELYLIYKDGRLLKNVSAVEVKTDTDIMSGMLTAINDFVQDSFNTEGDLGSIDYGNNKIILQRGNHSYLAAVIYGEIDNKFKGKLINAVRTIETINPSMNNWDGDGESVKQTEVYLTPIIDETIGATREMVDNYFTEKEIVVTTTYEKIGTNIEINVNISNYSSASINNCKISPEFNNSLLGLVGIEPDIFYSFADNSFIVGEVSSYNEIQFKLRMQIKAAGQTNVEIKMGYEQKGRKGTTVSTVNLI